MGTHKVARETGCDQYTRPESERACQAPPCPLYTWRAEEWQEVSRARKWAPASPFAQPPCSHHIRSPVKPSSTVQGWLFPKRFAVRQPAEFTLSNRGWESSSFFCCSYVCALDCQNLPASRKSLTGLGPNTLTITFTEGGRDGKNILNLWLRTWSFCMSSNSPEANSREDLSWIFVLLLWLWLSARR